MIDSTIELRHHLPVQKYLHGILHAADSGIIPSLDDDDGGIRSRTDQGGTQLVPA
ncbi:hypothetical protein [Streptomyces adustus]|uniref:hypothetical protein n=1 Tax=Streptomyces adustus TaxID=1609272 RepID=UPI0012DFF00A|nr:hypothetical protein [Streptomyces adustus]